jgi:hypothetical protein
MRSWIKTSGKDLLRLISLRNLILVKLIVDEAGELGQTSLEPTDQEGSERVLIRPLSRYLF